MVEYDTDSAMTYNWSDNRLWGFQLTDSELDSIPLSELNFSSRSLPETHLPESVPTNVVAKISLRELWMYKEQSYETLLKHTYTTQKQVIEKLRLYEENHSIYTHTELCGIILELTEEYALIRLHRVDEPIEVPPSSLIDIYPCLDRSISEALDSTETLLSTII